MKNLAYLLLKLYIKSGLFLYYGRIKIHGLGNVPKDLPVLFLPNHQGALMDVLLIVTNCRRKPYFLTRSDVFGNPMLEKFFAFLRMLPIYRMRDGRDTLRKNQEVFDRCAHLFKDQHAIVMFPEANHNRKRRVRPLSKGFTRILFNAFKKSPNQNVHIVPVGMNYVRNDGFPDKVALYYGESILANDVYDPSDDNASATRLKKVISDRLRSLTTHIGDELDYENTVQKLDSTGVDYLKPVETNAVIGDLKLQLTKHKPIHSRHTKVLNKIFRNVFKSIFWLLNFPVIAIWRIWVKPKVWETEFTATLRFGFALLVYPLYYLVLFVIFGSVWNAASALFIIIGIFLLNVAFVKRF